MKRVVLALSLTTIGFASEAIEQGRPLTATQIPAGILESSRFQMRDGWGFDLSAQFNEYAASQDSMEVATTPNGPVIHFDSDFRPGFSLGFVVNTSYDQWNFGGDYLWFQGNEKVAASAEDSAYLSSPIFHLPAFDYQITNLRSTWDLNINLADLYLTRPYYSGKSLTFQPFMGLRGAAIYQDFKLDSNVVLAPWESQAAHTKSHSWGIGPRVGMQSNFLLGYGLSFFGDLSTSLLYTTFTKISATLENSLEQRSVAKNNNAQIIQPIIDASIGFSLGGYAWRDAFYANLQLSYNFAAFFSQNMARGLISTMNSEQAVPANLYLQGVSIGLAFLF